MALLLKSGAAKMGEFFILYISNVDRSIYAHEFGRLRSSEEGHSEELRPLQRFKAIYCTITAKKKITTPGKKASAPSFGSLQDSLCKGG